MVQNRPILDIVSHLVLIVGILIVALPIWITFVAATHDPLRMTQAPIPLLPGSYFWENFVTTLFGKACLEQKLHRSGVCFLTLFQWP